MGEAFSQRLKNLVDRAKEMQAAHEECIKTYGQHDFAPDGESLIFPGTVRSYVCTFCGCRVGNLPDNYERNPAFICESTPRKEPNIFESLFNDGIDKPLT